MNLQRSIKQWASCCPHAMAVEQSPAAIEYAFKDAKADIAKLSDDLSQCRASLALAGEDRAGYIEIIGKMKELLRWIGYPARGTAHDRMDIYEAAKLIQDNFTLEELE